MSSTKFKWGCLCGSPCSSFLVEGTILILVRCWGDKIIDKEEKRDSFGWMYFLGGGRGSTVAILEQLLLAQCSGDHAADDGIQLSSLQSLCQPYELFLQLKIRSLVSHLLL